MHRQGHMFTQQWHHAQTTVIRPKTYIQVQMLKKNVISCKLQLIFAFAIVFVECEQALTIHVPDDGNVNLEQHFIECVLGMNHSLYLDSWLCQEQIAQDVTNRHWSRNLWHNTFQNKPLSSEKNREQGENYIANSLQYIIILN